MDGIAVSSGDRVLFSRAMTWAQYLDPLLLLLRSLDAARSNPEGAGRARSKEAVLSKPPAALTLSLEGIRSQTKLLLLVAPGMASVLSLLARDAPKSELLPFPISPSTLFLLPLISTYSKIFLPNRESFRRDFLLRITLSDMQKRSTLHITKTNMKMAAAVCILNSTACISLSINLSSSMSMVSGFAIFIVKILRFGKSIR
mmetsp:Transcript_4037/g.9828  ORF Transcript_4037/g.9828 Transcript_4037/m.9828 type:complete len:201 (+) Transcript_4037:1837-2439(+)